VNTHAIALSGTGYLPPSGVTWGSVEKAGSAYTWNSGAALGRTVDAGTQRLHLAYATDRVGGKWATNSGPHEGIYYVRSTSGSTWSTPKRLNPSSQHAGRVALAAAGSRVYVAWVSQTRITNYSPTAPRVLYVRVNVDHGSSTAWKGTIRLTSTSGRVDYPTAAATGNDVYVTWTDSNTGNVRVARSHDRGATWHQATIGTTTSSTSSGKEGDPSVAANGSSVAVTWVADDSGAVQLRLSTDRANTWGSISAVGGAAIGTATTAVAGTRVAVAWTTADDVVVRQQAAGIWGLPYVVSSLAPGTPPVPYSPTVSLLGADRIGVAWAAERNNTGTWSDLRWAESADAGGHWFAEQTVASAASTSARRLNDWPSVVWASAGTRYIAWNGWTSGSSNYRLYLRRGSGTPVGPAAAATVWMPGSELSVAATPGDRRTKALPPAPTR